jgi:hypothetical protein
MSSGLPDLLVGHPGVRGHEGAVGHLGVVTHPDCFVELDLVRGKIIL